MSDNKTSYEQIQQDFRTGSGVLLGCIGVIVIWSLLIVFIIALLYLL